MRVEKAARNIVYDYMGNIITLVVSFISKTVFIYTLGQEYVGLSGLFTNVLMILSLAELGIGSAITFELYKPLAEKDDERLYTLMQFYKKAYIIIGFAMLALGLAIIPLLKYIVNFDSNVDINYTALYLLFLINTVFSYWFNAYKATILIASQQKYLTKKIEYVLTIVQTAIQIFVLFVFKNYFIFLLVMIVRCVLQNYLIARKADKVFPILKQKKKTSVEPDVKKKIYKNIYALSLYKISGVALNATDNIVISAFISTNMLACYSLYNYIVVSIKGFLAIIFDSFVAAVGDFNATENNDRKKDIFNSIFFLSFILYGAVSVGLVECSSHFIELWAGKEYLMTDVTVYLMTFAFFIAGLENATYIFRTGCGLYDVAKYRPLMSAVVNLVVSIVLAKYIGIDGVFIGTIVSRLLTYWIVDPKVVYKHILKLPVHDYYVRWIKYTIVTCAAVVASDFINGFIGSVNWLTFIAKGLIGEFVFFAFVIILFGRTAEFKYVYNSVKNIVGKILKHGKA